MAQYECAGGIGPSAGGRRALGARVRMVSCRRTRDVHYLWPAYDAPALFRCVIKVFEKPEVQ